MKKVIIKNNSGIELAKAEMQDPSGWIADCISNNFWGKPERWILEGSEEVAPSDILETEVRDEYGELKTWVKLKAEYTIEITDVTFDHALQECIQNRIRAYPSPEEFLNAFFDGPEIALDLLRQRRYEVKAKYPKPTQG
jgi:hypothetical protein